VPLKAIVCGEPPALSVMVTVPVCAPVLVGAKWPWIVQFAPTASVVPQLLANTNCDASVPVTAMLVMDKAAVPVLVMVTVCELLMEPTVMVPNERLVADRVTGGFGVVPVPLSVMVCGEVAAPSLMVTAAVSAPETVGAKWPWMVQLAPAARLVPQLFAKTKEDVSAPVSVMLVIDNAEFPLLVSVTVCELPVEPTFTDPKDRLVADRLTGGLTPVPLSVMVCGDVEALSVMVTNAVRVPAVMGAKWPWMVQLAPAARLVPQVLAKT